MVKLNERYLLEDKVVVIHDIVYDDMNGNFVFFKEENKFADTLRCDTEDAFLFRATKCPPEGADGGL